MRTPRHIAMIGCTTPSHVYPSLGVIAELVRRGHRVSYAIGDRLAGLITPTGAEPVTFTSTLPAEDGDWPDNPAAELATQMFLTEGIATLPLLAEHYRDDRPDLLIHDIGAQAARVLGANWDVPAVLLSPTWVAWAGFEQQHGAGLEAMRTSVPGKEYHEACTAWLAANGIDRDAWDWMGEQQPIISLIPPVLQPLFDQVRPGVQFVGPCLDPARLAEQTWTAPDDGRRVLLVSLGTLFNDRPDILRAAAEAFADTDWQVVMAIGQRVDPACLGPLPANVEAHRSVPQLAVLAAASAFITHAGMGSCVEALYFGVPTVAIPLAAEQFGNAAILTALGVGQLLPAEQVRPALLRGAVEAVASSPAIAGRLATIRATVRAHGGVAAAADAIESHLP
ncbi:UDP glycosyltransferase [Frankia sp. AiPs1]|uniref:macrolide family glycosyltransferase n=1 Tax=Frankia sp. AiPs1 TaxID=573493 RepID=UPI002043757D|nr:macrolide family glycosyltransferase [Frankia sp. AiPs1]MCM3923397.1 UDP glycosyltransferase [Frankia sp. AiPs1]